MKKSVTYLIVILATVYLTNCSTLHGVTEETINGKNVQFFEKGDGSPTIVFETGLGPTIETWSPILDTLSTFTKVFAYNRPGYGTSTIINTPRTSMEVAKQLRDNLKSKNIPPPYILVGHSAGGLFVNMFARQYPSEVAGVVFLDASHPEQFEYFRDHHRMLYDILIMSIKKSNRHYELDLVKNVNSDFKNAPKFPNVPSLVLTAGKKSSLLETKKLREKWLSFQRELTSLSSQGLHKTAKGSGHFIHQDRPDLVINEIRNMVEKFDKKD
nr:alpha/beta hydrolase [Allomuricauda sp.]